MRHRGSSGTPSEPSARSIVRLIGRRSWWNLIGRIALSVTALAATGFVAVAIYYRLIGLPFTLTV